MKKFITKPVVTAALLAAVTGASGVPLSAGAVSGYHNWNDNSWQNYNNHERHISNWEARNIAQRYMPNRFVVSEEDHWDNQGRREHRVRFNDNHCVDVRDDGVVIRVFVIIYR
jgi:hypothetical protein